ncbi:MAG: hypothetical protein ABI652_01950, partial [Acidobacteriota bacterium]
MRTSAGRATVPILYLPAAILGGGRILVVTGNAAVMHSVPVLARIELVAYVYLAVCLTSGLALMLRALTRLRSVTARRQLRWIVWGSSVGAVPFILLYI